MVFISNNETKIQYYIGLVVWSKRGVCRIPWTLRLNFVPIILSLSYSFKNITLRKWGNRHNASIITSLYFHFTTKSVSVSQERGTKIWYCFCRMLHPIIETTHSFNRLSFIFSFVRHKKEHNLVSSESWKSLTKDMNYSVLIFMRVNGHRVNMRLFTLHILWF